MTHNSLMTKQIQISSKILIKIAINSSNIKTPKKSTQSDDDKRSHVRIFKPRYEYRLLISYSLLWLIKLKNLLSLWNLSTAAKSQTHQFWASKNIWKFHLWITCCFHSIVSSMMALITSSSAWKGIWNQMQAKKWAAKLNFSHNKNQHKSERREEGNMRRRNLHKRHVMEIKFEICISGSINS